MKNTGYSSREELQAYLKHKNRQLIPVNLIIIILSVISALSLMFQPLITINFGTALESVSEMTGESSEEESPYAAALDSFGGIELSFTTYNIMQFAFADDAMDYIVNFVTDEFSTVVDDVISTALTKIISNMAGDLPIDLENIDVDAIMNKFDAVANAKSEAEVRQAIDNLSREVQKQTTSSDGGELIPDSVLETFNEMLYEMYEDTAEALEGKDMNREALICVTISKMLAANGMAEGAVGGVRPMAAATETGSEGPVDGTPDEIPDEPADETPTETPDGGSDSKPKGAIYTTYPDLINALLGGSSESVDGESPIGAIGSIFNTVSTYAKYVVIGLLFFVGVWALLAFFAFLHLFLRNKRVTMWYVKMFGVIPCLILWGLPFAAKTLVPKFFPQYAAYLGILGALSTMTWISGICYALLWLVSIFWAFPIKRKIRRTKRELKYLNRG